MATTVQQIYDTFCDRVLESSGLQLGIITTAQFLDYFSDTLINFLRDTGCSKLIATQTIGPGQSGYIFPDRLMDVECAFTTGRFLPHSNLETIDNGSYQWRAKAGQPKNWYEDGLPIKTVALVPKPDWQGTPYSGYKFIDGTDPGSYTGTVNVYGSIVVWVSGAQFRSEDSNWAGRRIDLNGTLYSISAVPSGVTLILGTSAGAMTGAAYSVTYPIVIPAAERNLTTYGSQIPKGTQVRNCETVTETVSVTAQALMFEGNVTRDSDAYPTAIWAGSGASAPFGIPTSPDAAMRIDLGNRDGNPQFHFYRGTAHYAILAGGSGTAAMVYKSTNGDVTWSRLNQSGEPGGSVLAAAWDGADSVWTVHTTAAGGGTYTVTLRRFSLTADTWQGDSGGTLTITGSAEKMAIVFLSSGSLRLFYVAAAGTLFADNDQAAWGVPVVISVSSLGWLYPQHQQRSFMDNSVTDVTHLWYDSFTGSFPHPSGYLRVAFNGTTSAAFSLPSGFRRGAAGANGWGLFDSTANSMVKPVIEYPPGGTPYSKPSVYRGTPLENPVWTLEYVNSPGNTDNWALNADLHYLFRGLNGDEISVFVGSDPADFDLDTAFFISRRGVPAGNWSHSEILYSVISEPYPDTDLHNDPLLAFPFWLEEYTATTTVTFTTCVDEPVKRTWHLSDVVPLIPDSACLYVGFGILAKALADNSELKDSQKSLYATGRYQEGVQLFRAIMTEELLTEMD